MYCVKNTVYHRKDDNINRLLCYNRKSFIKWICLFMTMQSTFSEIMMTNVNIVIRLNITLKSYPVSWISMPTELAILMSGLESSPQTKAKILHLFPVCPWLNKNWIFLFLYWPIRFKCGREMTFVWPFCS